MSEEWKPIAPPLRKGFAAAHEGKKENPMPPPGQEIISKKMMEDLEKQRTKPAPQMHLRPPGVRSNLSKEQVDNAYLERLKKRFHDRKKEIKRDFDKSADRDRG